MGPNYLADLTKGYAISQVEINAELEIPRHFYDGDIWWIVKMNAVMNECYAFNEFKRDLHLVELPQWHIISQLLSGKLPNSKL